MTSQCPPQIESYRDLSRIFGNRNGRVLEFEILPPAFGPFLEDDCSIGITKKYLVQAFVTARKVFFHGFGDSGYNSSSLSQGSLEEKAANDELEKTIAIASEIILLFDCEHLTACNWRKRRLTALANSSLEDFARALDNELSLMTTYLCSPLHRHTKSPTLWQHRQWIQSQLIQLRKPDYQAAQELLETELSAILRAGERHPRNYYAFSYMRQIHRLLSEVGDGETHDWSAQLGQSIISSILDWCLAHPTDISGLMFLLYLLGTVPDAALRSSIVTKVARFALDIGWEGESVWTFVDLAVRKFSPVSELKDSQRHPWDILLEPGPLNQLRHDSYKARPPWKSWVERAQVHWAHTEQRTNNPS
ncbi:hypothetical protein BJX63DRAFT_147926 [Aspergillus granulosus]|uniref:Uncharacterized protein n=1 Tax=Aspergillus granulosus TaxID=176169 RepID=A0ABR4HN35_9EURO